MKRFVPIAALGCCVLSCFLFFNFVLERQNPGGVKLSPYFDSPTFPEASISLANAASIFPVGKDTFKFKVSNYTLGAQTPDADAKLCANSAKGQHIHFIIDNEPYIASYSEKIAADVKDGHHVLLAFLSRSYHESLKTNKSFLVKEFNSGKGGEDNFVETDPHLFYSRPKGEYIGSKETTKILLDFYLTNCRLSDKGYRVRATVGGKEFMITKWVPYMIEGLPLGEHTVKLELLDKTGALVKSPYNPVERKFTLKPEDPQPQK